MTPLLLLIACFQFLCACLGLQQSPVYFGLNPYVTLAPMFVIWLAGLGFYSRTQDKNFLLLIVLVSGVQAAIFGAYSNSQGFPFIFIRSLQFFWGPVLLTPMLLGLFRLTGSPGDPLSTARNYIWWLCVLASSVTFLEVLLTWVLGVPPASLPWVSGVYPGIHRPFGLVVYPQPNAVFLALLFWFSFLYEVPGWKHRAVTLAALLITLGGTGALTFLVLIPLWTRRPFLFSTLGAGLLAALIGYATLTQQYGSGGVLEKFDMTYSSILLKVFARVIDSMLTRFSYNDIIFGSQIISSEASIGLTHDWAYFDVFYVSGLFGVLGYTLLYGTLIFIACPKEQGWSMRLYLALVALLANFHYGTLNYFVGQMFFSTLAALSIYRSYAVEKSQKNQSSDTRPALGFAP